MRGTIGVALASVLAALCFAAAAGGGDSVRVEVVHSPFLHGTLLILPGWYGDHDNPAIPVVLAPHPPGRPADAVASFWRDYPARGGFAVLSPALTDDVVGGRLAFLAHVRKYAMLAVPWLRLDSTRIYAFGSGVVARSLLLLAARYPWAIEGVAAADPIFDLPAPGSRSPSARQPSAFLRDLAFARVPLQIWSPNGDDALAAALKRADPRAPVVQARGGWAHDLSVALLGFGLLPLPGSSQRIVAEPAFLGSSKPFGSTDFPGASSCRSRPGALSYGWPVAPFDQPHPVRGGFGDPRTVFGLVSPDDPNPRGTFSFHNGVDISADPGTPVYPVLSGVAQFVGKGEVDVRTGDGRVFRYIHIIPQIELGDRVRKDETVLGTVEQRAGHVHLSEVMNGRIVNPLAPGHLTPWTDDTTPVVHDVAFTDPLTGKPVDPEHLSGSVRGTST